MIESGSSLFYLSSFFLSSATSQSLNSCDGVFFLKTSDALRTAFCLDYLSLLVSFS